MKKAAFCLTLIILCCCSILFFAFDEDNLGDLKLKGKVKMLTETKYECVDSNGITIRKKPEDSTIYTFNSAGYEDTWKIFIFYLPGGVIKKEMVASHIHDSILLKCKYYGGEHAGDFTTYEHDKHGHYTARVYHGQYETLTDHFIWENDRMKEKVSLSGKDTSIYVLYSYNENGLLKEERTFVRSKVNEKGLTSGLRSYSYDDRGRMTTVNYAFENGPGGRLTYKYNDQGDIIEKAYFSSPDTLATTDFYSYEYDAQGNWIKCISHVENAAGQPNSNFSTLTVRTIVYYE